MKVIELRDDYIELIDQTKLPEALEYLKCHDIECLAKAIKNLSIRGAPALGVAAAFGLALVAKKNIDKEYNEVLRELEKAGNILKSTRPTAVNLFWAVDRILKKAKKSNNPAKTAIEEANKIYEENKEVDRMIAIEGAKIIENGDIIITHCNTGILATAGYYGTALGVIIQAFKEGKDIKVFADETRPLLQGARLTSFELVYHKIPVYVIPDGASGFIMKKYGVTKAIVGADRIASNGDTANKIGTYNLAIVSKEHNVEFYVAAPLSTIDLKISSGEEIPIEFRSREEIEFFNGKRIVAEGADIINPAFDVTPNKYIDGIITEKGILRRPYEKSIKEAFGI